MTAFGTLCNSLPRPSSDEKSWIGITDAENLHKVGGSIKRLNQAQALLWKGQVDETLALFEECQKKQAQNFYQYLRSPIDNESVNYDYFQAQQLCSISSGAVESTIKQIDRRIQISRAQWHVENVPQVLAHRCAYLNGLIGSQR